MQSVPWLTRVLEAGEPCREVPPTPAPSEMPVRGTGTWCGSHAFWETNALRRTVQIAECSLLHGRAQRRVSSYQGLQPVFVKTSYTL